jgi:uncharacterized protein
LQGAGLYLAQIMRISETDFVLVPGAPPSDRHWIARWWRNLDTATLVPPPPPDAAGDDDWGKRLLEKVAACTRPRVIVAHGRGAALVVSAHRELAELGIAGAMLVAPCEARQATDDNNDDGDPGALPDCALGFPVVMIAPRNNPYLSFERSEVLAATWNAQLVDAGETGTLDDTTGHGPWPEGLLRLGRFLNRLGSTK